MGWQLPCILRGHLADINRDVRIQHWKHRHVRVDAAKCAYLRTLSKVRERCGDELWEELKRHKQAWDDAVKKCRAEDEHERRKNAATSN